MTSTPDVDWSSLLGVDRVENLFKVLVAKVDAQAKKIASLESQLAHRLRNDEFDHERNQLTNVVTQLQERLETVESRITVLPSTTTTTSSSSTIGSKLDDIGSIVSRHERVLVDVTKRLGAAVTRGEFQALTDGLTKSEKRQNTANQRKFASSVVVNDLQDNFLALSNQLEVLSAQLATKVDQTAMANWKVTASKLNRFETFHDKTEERLENAEAQIYENTSNTKDHKRDIQELLLDVKSHEENLRNKVDRNEFEPIAKSVLAHDRIITVDTPRKKDIDIFNVNLKKISKQIQETELQIKALVSQNHREFQQMRKVIADCPSKKQVDLKADKFTTIQEMNRLQSEIDLKAWSDALEQISSKLKTLTDTRIETLEKKNAIAMRFIEWYSKNAKSYEHNFKSIERQMALIAIKSQQQLMAENSDATIKSEQQSSSISRTA
eukprot:g4129.t1